MISRLLVANRGEIARRVMRTCRQAGISTVAVFADPDECSPYVGEADLAVRLPGTTSARTYLDGAAIVTAALASGADAIHPGYGFLSEDHRFARQVQSAGLTWVGPPPAAMAAMALKIEARKTAIAAGVPVLPELDPASVTRFPVLVKASAGGGGRGMRAVASAGELADAIDSAQREARSAFGDGTVFCEPLLTGARHVEVQVVADQHGTIWTLTERDCSVQRRYAKVIEESPSPVVQEPLRRQLLAAAEALARAVGYVNAGTVEFLLSGSGEFYFLEFNTRLQVEHPVTECLHDLDLVALQLGIAEGQPLPALPPAPAGHAIEARLYAEDPVAGFRPSAGRVHAFAVPAVDTEFGLASGTGATLRLDAGVAAGSVISTHYDAMLGKLIVWAPTRDEATRRLVTALAGASIAGPATNRDLLVSVLGSEAFAAGGADTSLLEGYDYGGLVPGQRTCELSAAAAAAVIALANRRDATAAKSIPGGWRNVRSQPQRRSFSGPGGRLDVAYRWDGAMIAFEQPAARLVEGARTGEVRLDVEGVSYRFRVIRAGEQVWVSSVFGSVMLELIDRLPAPQEAAKSGSLIAPMPGSVIKVAVDAGDQVTAGQVVLVLEAMKMEHQVLAPADGVLTEVRVSRGTQVHAGDVLAVVSSDQE